MIHSNFPAATPALGEGEQEGTRAGDALPNIEVTLQEEEEPKEEVATVDPVEVVVR